MFCEIEKTRTFISDTLYLRYDIRAMAAAEKAGVDITGDLPAALSDPAKAVAYLRAGLTPCLKAMRLTQNEISTVVCETVKAFGAKELALYMLAATKAALPKAVKGVSAKPEDSGGNIRRMMHLFVDVMGRSEKEFLSLTLREAAERWDDYAVFMGYKKADATFKRYDDD